MNVDTTLLVEVLVVAALIAAVGGYAGILRRRNDGREVMRDVNESNVAAVHRVARLRALGKVSHGEFDASSK